MPRLFVGVPAPDNLDLSGVRNQLKQRESNIKLVEPSLYHVTLAFLGDAPKRALDTIRATLKDATADHTPSHGQARGLGAFPSPSRASVVWSAIEDTNLAPLAASIRAAFHDAGIEFDDRHDFHPHLTLARLRNKRDLSPFLNPHEATEFGAFPVTQVCLYESTLTPDGPEYDIDTRIHLEEA